MSFCRWLVAGRFALRWPRIIGQVDKVYSTV